MMCNNPIPDLFNMNAYIKFDEILSNCSQDIERKRNSDGRNGGMTDRQNDGKPKSYIAPTNSKWGYKNLAIPFEHLRRLANGNYT